MRIGIFSCILLFLLVLGGNPGYSQNKEEVKKEQNPYFWDFGQVSQGKLLEHTFKLKNDSSDTLRITGIHTSCGCTTSQIEKTEISPGESVNIQVRFNTKGYSGTKEQFVYIHTDQQENPTIKLTLKADIKK
jgi:hypothetical protein